MEKLKLAPPQNLWVAFAVTDVNVNAGFGLYSSLTEAALVLADLRANDLIQVRKERGACFFLHDRRPELYERVVGKSPGPYLSSA